MIIDGSEKSLRKFLSELSPVDQVGAEARAAMLATRSIKTSSKAWAIDMAISMVDLTTLEGADTPGKIKTLCAKAVRPDPTDSTVPSVGAICVYNDMVRIARSELDSIGGNSVPVAAVATAFPSGRASLAVKKIDTQDALDAGASEIDMVIDRGAFLSGRLMEVFEEIRIIKELCGNKAHLKVILETGELVTYDNVRKASYLAMLAGADFIKTSTGKIQPAATMPVTLTMLEAIRDYYYKTGKMVGMKAAGGISKSKLALHYLVMVKETLGEAWLDKKWFRFGASSLANDVLMQVAKEEEGTYQSATYFSID